MGAFGANGLHTANLLERAQRGVGLEGSALHDNLGTQRVDPLGADDAEQGVLHHRVRDTCRQIVDARADLLGVFDAGGHEYCALCPQVNRVFRGKCGVVERVRVQAQRMCGPLDERSAAARACFVEDGVRYHAVLDPERLHVLSADVEHERRVGHELHCRAGVRRCLHDA